MNYLLEKKNLGSDGFTNEFTQSFKEEPTQMLLIVAHETEKEGHY
jgi:hypothetical protein